MKENFHERVKSLMGLNRVVHEPARLAILTVLSSAKLAEFKLLEKATGLSKGNLNSHTTKLESTGYLTVRKSFRGKVPVTTFHITEKGMAALADYWKQILKAQYPEIS